MVCANQLGKAISRRSFATNFQLDITQHNTMARSARSSLRPYQAGNVPEIDQVLACQLATAPTTTPPRCLAALLPVLLENLSMLFSGTRQALKYAMPLLQCIPSGPARPVHD